MQFAPVAEYRGVCILEKHGHQRAVWHGREYQTDGMFYVIWWVGDEKKEICALGLPDELACKELIDGIRDQPDLINASNEPPLASYHYLSWIEAWEMTAKRSWEGPVPKWYWSETAGHFLRAEDRVKDAERWSG